MTGEAGLKALRRACVEISQSCSKLDRETWAETLQDAETVRAAVAAGADLELIRWCAPHFTTVAEAIADAEILRLYIEDGVTPAGVLGRRPGGPVRGPS